MLPTHAVGIDLGTTYSCIAYLNEHGEPVTIPNRDGELSTPSVVMFDGDEVIVGTEALRNSIRHPDRVVMHAKRYLGHADHRWTIQNRHYTATDISTEILRSLLHDARERIGNVERAVVTVPAQFSDVQRQLTAEAGRRAGLKHVDIINEPVAAALCFVLGTEGIWFTELASSQLIMVADLGGGTFDLSLVRYEKNSVRVVASGGDLHLGGLDWNNTLEKAITRQFQKEFGIDLQQDREARQALSIEVEQAKRSLSVRPRAALTCQHAGRRKTYQVDLEQFERLSRSLVDRMADLSKQLLAENKLGWARIDVVLTTGGASRMPMVRQMLKNLSGRTLNTSLSPDQSIAHGATYYAGMLLTNNVFAKSILNPTAAARLQQFKQQSVNARALGILVRDVETKQKVPHYLLPASTQLPASVTQIVGTVIPNQHRAHLSVIESGTAADAQYVHLGSCIIDPLPENLPEGSEIEVSIRYDEQARVHVSAKVLQTGHEAHAEIVRPENLLVSALTEEDRRPTNEDVAVKPNRAVRPVLSPVALPARPQTSAPAEVFQPLSSVSLESAEVPIPLCNQCGEPLNALGRCSKCPAAKPGMKRSAPAASGPSKTASKPPPPRKPAAHGDDVLIDLDEPRTAKPAAAPAKKPRPAGRAPEQIGEEEFWKLTKKRPRE